MKAIWWFLSVEHQNGSALTMTLLSFLLNSFFMKEFILLAWGLAFKLLIHTINSNFFYIEFAQSQINMYL